MHSHAHPTGLEARRGDSRRRMLIALAINAVMLVVELVGGLISGSLAVLADAGHVLSDVGAIALGLMAAALAARPGGSRRTFGFQRSEVLAALANGLILLVVGLVVAIAAVGRLGDPPEVDGAGVLALGLFGLAGNVAATVVLARGERADINLEGVLRHSLADALGSLGVVLAGLLVLLGASSIVDPIVGLLIAILIVASCWRLIKEPFDVLMESAPTGIDVESVGAALCEEADVCSVHDLHIWTLTPGFPALAAHVVVSAGSDRDLTRQRLEALLRERYGIDHTTLQLEEEVGGGLLEVEPLED